MQHRSATMTPRANLAFCIFKVV